MSISVNKQIRISRKDAECIKKSSDNSTEKSHYEFMRRNYGLHGYRGAYRITGSNGEYNLVLGKYIK